MLKVVLNEYSESGISESFLNSEMQNNCWQFLPHKGLFTRVMGEDRD